MVLEKTQVYRFMDQNKNLRNKHINIWPINLQQRNQRQTMWKNSVLRKLDSHIQKSETVPLSYIIHKSQLKMN